MSSVPAGVGGRERLAPRMFFVLAQGRSGTAFLARLLDLDPRSCIRHEPWPLDPQILGLSRTRRFRRAVEALLEERFAALEPAARGAEIYGEVNSFLRYDADWLRRRFDPYLLHVVRDGRDFVRSAYGRDVLTPKQAQLPIVPDDDDPDAAAWGGMSRFERICWIWAHTNRMLAESVPHHVRLEDLLTSYDAFRDALLVPTGIEVGEEAWQEAVARPVNTTTGTRKRRWLRSLVRLEAPERREQLPPWPDWPAELTGAFWRICGPTMERLGYPRAAGGA